MHQRLPPLVNYQGLLTDDGGTPIPDGMKKLEFNLYDAPIKGNKVWGPQVFDSVPIVNGRFNVILGTTDTGGRSIAGAFSTSQRYLSFKVATAGQDMAAIPEMSPRQQILSTPFAITADVARTVKGEALYVNDRSQGKIGSVQVDYLKVLPENSADEGGQIELSSSKGSPPVYLDVVGVGHFRVHSNGAELFSVTRERINMNNHLPTTLWRSPVYKKTPNQPGGVMVDLGRHTFCAIGQYSHSGGEGKGSLCDIYFDNSSSTWKLHYSTWGNGVGLLCQANCF